VAVKKSPTHSDVDRDWVGESLRELLTHRIQRSFESRRCAVDARVIDKVDIHDRLPLSNDRAHARAKERGVRERQRTARVEPCVFARLLCRQIPARSLAAMLMPSCGL